MHLFQDPGRQRCESKVAESRERNLDIKKVRAKTWE
jgi:hypothetical protein